MGERCGFRLKFVEVLITVSSPGTLFNTMSRSGALTSCFAL